MQEILKNNSGLFLITLGARLMTDDSVECKKMIANCLKLMFQKLSKLDLDTLFEIIILWLKDKKVCFLFLLFDFPKLIILIVGQC